MTHQQDQHQTVNVEFENAEHRLHWASKLAHIGFWDWNVDSTEKTTVQVFPPEYMGVVASPPPPYIPAGTPAR